MDRRYVGAAEGDVTVNELRVCAMRCTPENGFQIPAQLLAVPVIAEKVMQQRGTDNRGRFALRQTHQAGDLARLLITATEWSYTELSSPW